MLLAFNKPYGVLSQFTPEPGSKWKTLSSFGLPARVYSIGRLDADSEGLLLLSDEKALVDRILHPENKLRKVYWVQVERIPDQKTLERLATGIELGSYRTRPGFVARMGTAPVIPPREPPIRYRKSVPDCWISLGIEEGKNRQVRRMTAAIGHPTLRLIRGAIGALSLSDLRIAQGNWRELTHTERQKLLSSS